MYRKDTAVIQRHDLILKSTLKLVPCALRLFDLAGRVSLDTPCTLWQMDSCDPHTHKHMHLHGIPPKERSRSAMSGSAPGIVDSGVEV